MSLQQAIPPSPQTALNHSPWRNIRTISETQRMFITYPDSLAEEPVFS